MTVWQKSLIVLGALSVMVLTTAGSCMSGPDGYLRQMTPGSTVFVDAWDETGDEGDQAFIEEKPRKGIYVIPKELPFMKRKGGDFVVEVTLSNQGDFIVRDLAGTKIGKDHDNCQAVDENYVKLQLRGKAQPQYEPDIRDTGAANDDCAVVPAAE